ncbi:hypothetical protein NM688_g6156 [Phlebia brevispora]|uniref:Uncharacterized protein n=1 Tax=Phlebia brevispora TaxID=194682 RepID=A0ACC1SJ79_9APHY|nr:hypothetical protein NM688_g6156 [Phlebia brevispora]
MREQGGRLATRSTTISQSSTFAGPSNDPMDDDDIYGSDTPKSTYDPDTSEMLSSPYRRYGAPPAYHTLVGRE